MLLLPTILADPRVPFTNDLAEQALRRVKLQMKISGGFRTWTGAAHFAQVRGLLETARKQDRDLFAALQPDPALISLHTSQPQLNHEL